MEARRGGGGGGTTANGGGSNGWPLGLQPLNIRVRVSDHHIRFFHDGSPYLISTPSISSMSSSDLDTESTGSFFHERSTTLGTLIGIHSRSQGQQTFEATTQLLVSQNRVRKESQKQGCWSCFLILCCRASADPQEVPAESMSPSLAHFLELERRTSHLSEDDEAEVQDGEETGTFASSNTLFDDEGVILPPKPNGAPLKTILQQTSNKSSYLSADWSSSVPIVRRRRYRSIQARWFQISLCSSIRRS